MTNRRSRLMRATLALWLTAAALLLVPLLSARAADSNQACPTVLQCTVFGGSVNTVRANTFSPANPGRTLFTGLIARFAGFGAYVGAASCPSRSQCTVIFNRDAVETFDPRAPHRERIVRYGARGLLLWQIACPSTSECVMSDEGDSTVVSIDPQALGRRPLIFTLLPGAEGATISCPTATQCTAVGRTGDNRYAYAATTFDPQSKTSSKRVALAPSAPFGEDYSRIPSISCPSRTQCTVVDAAGSIATFDPLTSTALARERVVRSRLNALACPSTSECVAIEGNGDEFKFDPRAVGHPSFRHLFSSFDVTNFIFHLDCPTPRRCIGFSGAAADAATPPPKVFNP